MDSITLSATARDNKVKPKALRRAQQVPCVVYGTLEKTLHVQCAEKDLHKVFIKAGESTLVELDIAGKKVPVLFKEVTFDPITDREMHVDFYAVNMKEEIEAPVPIHVEGESPAVKSEGGILVLPQNTILVRCLPADLPHSLTINISTLAAFHDVITVKDLVLPKGVQVMETPETVIATVQEPRKEEVIAPVATDAAAAGAEGAAAGAAAADGAAAGAPAAAGAAPAGDKAKK